METDFLGQVVEQSVTLAVLVMVLVGVYKLTDRAAAATLLLVKECCEHLDRIADALEELRKE